MKQMILKIDDDVTELPSELNVTWLNTRMVGTRSFYNKIIILILSPVGILELEDKIEGLDLTWSVLATEDEPINQSEILPFIDDESVGDLIGKLQTFSGHRWNYQ